MAWRIDERPTAGFRQSICLQHVNAERMEIACDLRIKTRTAGNQQPHLFSKQLMDSPKKQPTRIEPNLPAKHRDAPHRLECNSQEAALLRHLFEDSFVDQI